MTVKSAAHSFGFYLVFFGAVQAYSVEVDCLKVKREPLKSIRAQGDYENLNCTQLCAEGAKDIESQCLKSGGFKVENIEKRIGACGKATHEGDGCEVLGDCLFCVEPASEKGPSTTQSPKSSN